MNTLFTKYWLITGCQIDGGHEYRCLAVMASDYDKPSYLEMMKALIELHAFGYDEEGEITEKDIENHNYGDGETIIQYQYSQSISKEEYDVLCKLGI